MHRLTERFLSGAIPAPGTTHVIINGTDIDLAKDGSAYSD